MEVNVIWGESTENLGNISQEEEFWQALLLVCD